MQQNTLLSFLKTRLSLLDKNHYFLLLGSLCLLFQTESRAQTPLSLADALTKSLTNNYSIKIEQKRVERTALNNNGGEAGRLPTILLNLGQNNGINNIDNPASFLSGNIINNSVQPSVSLNWLLFGGNRVSIEKSRLENLEQEAQGNFEIVLQNTAQAVLMAYYKARLEQERISVLEKVLKYSKDRYEYAKTKLDLGLGNSSEILLEETNYLTDSVNVLNQKLVARNAQRDLNLLLAEKNIDQLYILTDKLEVVPQDFDWQTLEKEMMAANADLRKQFLSQEVLKTTLAYQKALAMPTLNFEAGFSTNFNRQDLSQAVFAGGNAEPPQEPINARTMNYFGNFTVSFTLFNGGKIQRAIERARIDENIGNLGIEQIQLSLSRDLLAALDLYNVRKQLLNINTQARKVAERNLEISQERFQAGVINSFDYRQVQNNYQNAAFSELQAIYNLLDSHTTLLRLTGGILKKEQNPK
ncbi:TolC family protein [Hugenholtzia roseola]|uniref:TolC family protein n=1 Tax=Hugenholtzia roseola TaxID=1002 RepID=UPI000424780C|nr:TolC family protein [Hugenholtzia roseola]